MIGTKGKANYWFGYVHVAWTDERMFSEQKKKTVSLSDQNTVMAQSKSCQDVITHHNHYIAFFF
jgi:beta-xylosidase